MKAKSKTLEELFAFQFKRRETYESFEEKEHQKEEETSGKNRSTAHELDLLALRSHGRTN